MRTAGFWPPLMLTRPTPDTWAIFCANRVSARSSTAESGSVSDVSKGLNGTLRANYNGEPISLSDPTSLLFFNTSAFSIPAPGTFGNAGRNTIIGPGTSAMNLGLTKNITFNQTRGLSIQVLASNVFNTVQFATIDTYVNSPTFGQVTSVRPMRRIQLLFRFRF